MNVTKTKTHTLEKCYSIAPLKYNEKDYILVAAEKVNKCLMFDLEGNLVDTVWDGPGGTMSMVQIPNSNGKFLATHKFYSPNDSKEAKIVVVTPTSDGEWKVETLVDLPHVHRFDIIKTDGEYYIVAATLCSGRDFKDDWQYKGKVYAAKLPNDFSIYNEENQLPMKVVKDELLKNHGYYRGNDGENDYFVVGTEDGIYKFELTDKDEFEQDYMIDKKSGTLGFKVTNLLDLPSSDMTLVDLDGDGNLEMIVFSPFHGANLEVYKLVDGVYTKVYTHSETFDFSHALWSGEVLGKNVAILGHRQGKKSLIALYFENGEYKVQEIDENAGPANVFCYKNNNKTTIVAANRETDEIAFYNVE